MQRTFCPFNQEYNFCNYFYIMVSPSYIIFYKKGFWEVNIDRLFF